MASHPIQLDACIAFSEPNSVQSRKRNLNASDGLKLGWCTENAVSVERGRLDIRPQLLVLVLAQLS